MKRAIPAKESLAAARAANLVYTDPREPGIRRIRCGKSFRYVSASGRPIKDPRVLARIRSLAIPPAWEDVWICRSERGHVQATGRDAKGRKQYRYHPRWRTVRDETKFDRVQAFAASLPGIRTRVTSDLASPGMPHEKAVAAAVRLLDRTHARVGNSAYARDNGSFGITTLRNRHVRVRGTETRLRFRGKGGKVHELSLDDASLAKTVRKCQDLPGQQIFQYVTEDGTVRALGSGDVNAYIRETTGLDFTAKDFRTWGASVLFVRAASQLEAVTPALEEVAAALGNTIAVCKRSYVHPALIESLADGTFQDVWRRSAHVRTRGLRKDESITLAILRKLTSGATKAAA